MAAEMIEKESEGAELIPRPPGEQRGTRETAGSKPRYVANMHCLARQGAC